MSQVSSTATSSTDFESVFGAASEAYKTQTKKDIAPHPLATQLQSCNSPSAILAVLRVQVQAFDESQSADKKLTKWLDPTVNVLYAFAATLGNGVRLVFPPSNAVFAGIGIILQAVKDVRASQDGLVDLFGRIEFFFKRLEAYIEVQPTVAMTDVIVKIMVEVLSIFWILTKEIGQGRMEKYLKELVGKKDVKDALERLDKLTQEEARMAETEALKINRGIDNKVKGVDGKVAHIDERVQVVHVKVEEIDERVQSVDSRVQGVSHNVGSVIEGMKETGVAIRQTHPSISTLRAKLPTGVLQPGVPKGIPLSIWKASGSLLWIHGKPGSGKTILSSAIIRGIKSLSNAGSASMAYFFFDFKDTGKQDSRALLSSILIQLSDRSERCCDVLHELYSAYQNGAEQPTGNSLTQCLKNMLTITEQVLVYLIMDALDECSNDYGMPSPRETVLELVEELVELGRSNLRLCHESSGFRHLYHP
ncbi:hypothetical protein EDB87DRAFT_1681486 [Lactarius vividus]|nr:hypothetical protein EDB87DRAFT_1681486 [Lactarius vividus]